MPGFDALAPDQKAVLQLLLKQGKTYADIAGLLRLDATSVRERALDALDAIGAELPGAAELSSERQDEIADHLLLQQTASQRAATRTFLEGSAPGRSWARGVAAELRPIGGDALPDIPAEPAEVAAAFDALDEREASRERGERESRLGGVLVIVAVVAALTVLALAIIHHNRGGSDDTAAVSDTTEAVASTPDTTPTTATATAKGSGKCRLVVPEVPTSATSTAPTGVTGAVATEGAASIPTQSIVLKAAAGAPAKAKALAVVQEGGVAFEAQGLPTANVSYRLWLWKSRSEALPLGFARLEAGSKKYGGAVVQVPASAKSCTQLVLTRESADQASTTPGPIVFSGPVKQG